MKKKGNRNGRLTYFAFTIAPVILYTFFYVFAMVTGIYYSFTDWNGMNPEFEMVGFDNYRWLFENRNFWRSMFTTLRYALLLVISVISVSLVLSLALNSVKRFKTFTKSIFFIPCMIGSVTIALIWDQLFYRAVPLIGEGLGIEALSQSPLATPSMAMFAVVFVNVWQSVAMPTVIFIAGLQTIPDDLFESAQLDGATIFQRFRYITFPYILPTVTVNLVLLVKQGFTTFDFPYALTGGGPARANEVIAISIVNDAFANFRFSMANAEACVLFVVVAIISIFQITLSNRKGVHEA